MFSLFAHNINNITLRRSFTIYGEPMQQRVGGGKMEIQ